MAGSVAGFASRLLSAGCSEADAFLAEVRTVSSWILDTRVAN